MPRHVIKKLTFDVSISDKERAYAMQDDLSRLLKKQLADAMEEVFAAMIPSGQTVQIDSLEIDLGTVPYDSYEEELPRRLRERLEELLAHKLYQLEHFPTASERILAPEYSLLDSLLAFLQTGTLPWSALPGKEKPAALMERALDAPLAGNFARRLMLLPYKPAVAKRLSLQFADSQLCSLVALLDPANALPIIAYSQDLRLAHRHAPLCVASEGQFSSLSWQFVMEYLLNDAGSRFNQKSFARQLIGRIAQHHNIAFADFLETLRLAIPAAAAFSRFASSLPAIVQELCQEQRQADKQNNKQQKADEAEAYLASWLQAASVGPSAGLFIASHWEILLQKRPQPLCRLVRYWGAAGNTSHEIARSWDSQQIVQLIRLLEPAGSAFIESFSNELLKKSADSPLLQPKSQELRTMRWEFILAVLLQDRGSAFNRKMFARSTLYRMAMHNSIDYAELLAALCGSFTLAEQAGSPIYSILQVLAEEYEQLSARRLHLSARQAAPAQTRSSQSRHWIAQWLETGNCPADMPARQQSAGIGALLEQLFKKSPAQFRQLMEQLSQYAAVQNICRNSAAPAVLALIPYLIAYLSRCAAPRPDSPFMSSLAAHAQACGNSPAFFEQICIQLIGKKEVDLEAIAAACANNAAKEALPEAGKASDVLPPSPQEEEMPDLQLQGSALLASLPGLLRDPALGGLLSLLHGAAPAQFRLFMEQLSRKETAQAICRNCTAEAVLAFIPYLIAYLSRCAAPRLDSPFMSSLAAHAQACSNSPAFFEQACIQLIGKKEIDLEALAAACTDTSPKEALPGASRTIEQHEEARQNPKPKPLPIASPQQAAQLLEQILLASPPQADALAQLPILLPELMKSPRLLYERLMRLSNSSQLPQRFALRLSAAHCAQVFLFLLPRYGKALLAACSGIWENLRAHLSISGSNGKIELFWELLLGLALRYPMQAGSMETFLAAYLLQIKAHCLLDAAAFADFARSSLLAPLTQLTDKQKIQAMKQFALLSPASKPRVAKQPQIEQKSSSQENKLPMLEEIFVEYAGIVIVSVYLPRLFDMLGLLSEGVFSSAATQEHAVHILHYLASGQEAAGEHELALCKLMCGMPAENPLAIEASLSTHERETCDGLLKAVITNWKSIGNTSIDGLRGAFFLRAGRLNLREEGWQLAVEQKTYDVLLDSLPWGYSTIKHRWMERIISVQWR